MSKTLRYSEVGNKRPSRLPEYHPDSLEGKLERLDGLIEDERRLLAKAERHDQVAAAKAIQRRVSGLVNQRKDLLQLPLFEEVSHV